MARAILHLDLDAFFCAVEEQRDPSLRGKAFAVGGRPDQRGVVASCSYAARQFGVRSAMPMSQAVRICPDLLIVPQHFDLYRAASQAVMARLNDATPLVEQISIDEAFLDVTGLPHAGDVMARRLQAEIRDDLGLPCSFGVASSKLVAKIANNIGKAGARGSGPPNAITVVKPGQEAAFLAPLPITELWGVGPKTAQRLNRMGIRTIGDLAQRQEAELARLFGKNGADMARHARGIDERPVQSDHEARSISKETTFTHDVRDSIALKRTLRALADGVGRQLRKSGLRGTTVKVKLRWSDFTTLTRQTTLHQPVDQDGEIYAAALEVFEQTWTPGRTVRLLGVGVSGLEEAGARQLSLWEDQHSRKLQSTLDDLRDRFGDKMVRRGTDFKHEE